MDVRVLAATNKNLEEEIREGAFREDLYYRLNVVPLHVPPLRERPEDVPDLARHFLAVYAQENNQPLKQFAGDALEALARRDWPGNVRQLKNAVERLAILVESPVIGRAHLDELEPGSPRGAAGLAGAVTANRLLAHRLFGLSPADPDTYVQGVALIVIVGVTAAAIPAYRASVVSPVAVLREE